MNGMFGTDEYVTLSGFPCVRGFVDWGFAPIFSMRPLWGRVSEEVERNSKYGNGVVAYRENRMLAEQMLAAKEKLAQSKTDAETHRLEARCASLDRQIDAAVYELYGLTEEEIAIIEKP